MASKTPIRVAVTGAAGNIGYAAIFRLASGAVFGADAFGASLLSRRTLHPLV